MSVLSQSLRPSRRLAGHESVEEIARDWKCQKRDGQIVSFDPDKIRRALTKCFRTTGEASEGAVERITKAVVRALAMHGNKEPDVEEVQRLVIQQLWADGLFDSAEHYQNYREEHRKSRMTRQVSPATVARVLQDQAHFKADRQYHQFMSKFSRWREADKRRETWQECVYERVMPWFKRLPLVSGKLTHGEWAFLAESMFDLKAGPAMRVVQMAGPALDRCNVGAYNCAYSPIDELFALPEMLYILMQGSGHGFSVEDEYVSKFPRVHKARNCAPVTIKVEDSTEGWCEAYYKGLQLWMDGADAWFDVTGVRKKGERLKTKGGRSSGPEPFLELMSFARNLFKARQGKLLTDTDLHRLACFTGRIVQVGGVRRAALMSLSDFDSIGMRNIKSGGWWDDRTFWTDGRYLSMANNSAVYAFEDDVPVEVFMDEWLSLIRSKSGERGIFNRMAAERCKPERRKSAKWGCNPCAEIILRPQQFCNLSIAVARPDDTFETLAMKVKAATLFGLMQSTATKFNYIRPEWQKNCEEERLLGVDITGHADCPLLRYGAPGRAELLRKLHEVVKAVKREYAPRFEINPSAADTTVKPSGDSSEFFDCASGASARFADWQVRWFREQKVSPVSKFLIDAGVPYADAPEAPTELYVFGYPKEAPPGAMKRSDMTAIDQFKNWLEWKENWAEHSVSVTIYVDDHEWLELGALVYKHLDKITGVSFLPRDNGTYTYAPNEELTKEKYDELVASFPKLNWAKLQNYEEEDMTSSGQTYACVGDKCELG